jgi:protein-L-isoaspartate O-methyltransferase
MERLTLPWRRSCPLPADHRPRTVDHPLCARLYARQSVQAERLGLTDRRAQLLEGLAGRVLEIGAGNGLNFCHYPAAVEEVVAVEPERHLRGLAVEAASDSARYIATERAMPSCPRNSSALTWSMKSLA